MSSYIWYQNDILPKENVHISPDDRGYYFGDGIYEVFRVYDGRLFEAAPHFDRLERTAGELRIRLPQSREYLENKLNELIAVNQVQTGTVYLQITRGAAPRSHPFPPEDVKPVLYASTAGYERPIQTIKEGITAITHEDIRWLRCDLKTLNLLPNVLAKQAALDQGAQEVVLHRSGTVTECSASNVAIVKNGIIITHPTNNLILHGITRLVVLRLAHQLGIPVQEEPFTVDMLRKADEAFITGTTVEVTPLIRVDGQAIGQGVPGPVTRRLQDAFELAIAEM